jgi:murein DD-endopeptidase MepM/ murein hydrolase activator NlpD
MLRVRFDAIASIAFCLGFVMTACTGSSAADKERAKRSQGSSAASKTATVAAPGAAKTASAAVQRSPGSAERTGPEGVRSVRQGHGPQGPRYISVKIDNSLERALDEAIGSELGTPLSQVTTRVLVWWIDIRKDLRRGDQLDLVYEPRANEEPLLHAVWFTSGKLGGTRSAVSYTAAGQQYARWYSEDGSEVELRLESGPIDQYEQITSLLNDGRRHKGIDFKTAVGTTVKSPVDGTIVNRNWGKRNGNCWEIEDAKSGRHIKLLHLDTFEPGIGVGTRVKAGQTIARSGNTGHSMAPHLHYQIEAGGRVVDPFKIHKTWRAKLPSEEAEKAKAMLGRYRELRTGAS